MKAYYLCQNTFVHQLRNNRFIPAESEALPGFLPFLIKMKVSTPVTKTVRHLSSTSLLMPQSGLMPIHWLTIKTPVNHFLNIVLIYLTFYSYLFSKCSLIA